MKYIFSIYTVVFLLLFAYGLSHAQYLDSHFFGPESTRSNVAQVVVDFDPTFSLGMGYGRVIPLHFGDNYRSLLINGGLSVPIFLIPAMDTGNIITGASIFVFNSSWNLKTNLAIRAQAFNNKISKGSNYSFQVGLYPGYYSKRWCIAAQILYRNVFLTHLEHSKQYRDNFGGAKDGWYSSTASYFYFALTGGFLIRNRVSINARAGIRASGNFKSYKPYLLPWVFSLGANFWF